jgi:hypothetical protein
VILTRALDSAGLQSAPTGCRGGGGGSGDNEVWRKSLGKVAARSDGYSSGIPALRSPTK